MNKPLLLLSLLFCSLSLIAQQGANISGTVLDEADQAIPFATIVLHSTADSSMVKGELTDDNGNFRLPNIAPSDYWLKVSFVGKDTYSSESFTVTESENKVIPIVQLKTASQELATVVATAQRPIVEVKPDKMVFNVEGSINAIGNDGLELLRKAPGVVIDNNDNISLAGKSGVQVYIDGKPSPLSGEDLAALLKSMNSSEIDNIEIITNPSAKYDAEGNAGIINIKLKKDKRFGTNTTINGGFARGRATRYNGSISSNYRNKKVNVFGNYSYTDNEFWSYLNIYREQFGFANDQKDTIRGSRDSHNFKAGVDYFINKKHTIGFLVNGFTGKTSRSNVNRTLLSTVESSEIDSILIATSDNNGKRSNYNFNINYQFDGGNDRSWNIDVDYGVFNTDGTEYQPNFYTDPTGEFILQESIFTYDYPTKIDIAAFKIDYEQPLWKGKLGVGLKTAYVKTDNTFRFFNVINNVEELDIDRSSQFEYTENVNAAYATYGRQLGKFNLQLGLRLEQTNSVGALTADKITDNDNVTRHYLDVFPSGGLTYQVNPKNSLQFNYSRRINRPSYQDLNPFENKLSELSFRKGNPFLRPQYTNNFQLTHTYNYRFNTGIGFSHTTDLITNIVDTENEQATFITYLNLSNQYNYNLTFSAPITITKWWSSFNNATAYHLRNKAVSNGEVRDINIIVNAYRIYSQHTFSLPWDVRLEVSGWYSSPSVWGGTFETSSMWSLDAGVQKRFLDGRANIKLGISDIFYSSTWAATSVYGELMSESNGGWDSRQFKLNFSYLFGNQQVKSGRKRKTGLEEEQKRVKGDS